LRTNYTPKARGIPCWFIQRLGRQFADPADVSDELKILNKWKLLLPAAPIAGQTDFSKPVGFYYDGNIRIAKPGECCTESWVVVPFDTEAETLSFKSYLFTKTVRFLLLQTVISQHVTRKNFCFIPRLDRYEGEYTDAQLVERWGISADEWAFIDSKIKAVQGADAAEE
jgi:site-specific DNA-methyltransferase (adenine-specific)